MILIEDEAAFLRYSFARYVARRDPAYESTSLDMIFHALNTSAQRFGCVPITPARWMKEISNKQALHAKQLNRRLAVGYYYYTDHIIYSFRIENSPREELWLLRIIADVVQPLGRRLE